MIATPVLSGTIVASKVRDGRPGIRDGTSRRTLAVDGNLARVNAAVDRRLALVMSRIQSLLLPPTPICSVSAACGPMTAGEISTASGDAKLLARGTQIPTTQAPGAHCASFEQRE